MKKLIVLFLPLFVAAGIFLISSKPHTGRTVGIIVPMEHEALNQIVNGLREELNLETHGTITVKVMNAQGDSTIQRAIIEQLVREGCNLLIPIGTTASQMTLNLAKERDIVCLAADPSIISYAKKMRATALDDELAVSDSLSFLHSALPQIKKISLLYSSSEKVAKEIPLVLEAARLHGIEVQQLMIQSLSELYTMSQAIHADSGAVFILKDHLVVSGIQTIAQQAEKLGIPVMTSDEGSVIEGGAFAIGVKESSIGQQGAQIVKKILDGTPPQNISPQKMKGPFPLFINRIACLRQGIDLQTFITHAQEMGVFIHYVNEEDNVNLRS